MSNKQKPIIMIVDDEPVNLRYIGEMLDGELELYTFVSGLEALEYIYATDRVPDLILLDILMPHIDGYQICKELKSNSLTEHIPIIFMTALSDDADEEKGFLAGAVDYIKKPFSRITTRARVLNHINLKKYQDLLLQTSMIDSLTGIPNRRFFDTSITREFMVLKRYKGSIACLMIDIDNFKLFNDNYGHLAGDHCLIAVAQAINNSLVRKSDFCARYGGEEFIVLLPGTSKEGARKVAEVILRVVSSLKIQHEYSLVSNFVTVSIGYASVGDEELYDETNLVGQADKALYAAKKHGKNRAECDACELTHTNNAVEFPSVNEIATKNLVMLDSEVTIKTAVDTLTEKNIRNIIISNTQENCYNILSVGDIVLLANDKVSLQMPVSSLKLKILPICTNDMNILEVFVMFGKENAILGVIDKDDALCGVLTYSNMLNAVYGFDDNSFSKPVNDLIHKQSVFQALPDVLLSDCLEGLYEADTDCLIVIENECPLGIITKRDIAKFLSKGVNLKQPVCEMMSSPLLTVDASQSINMSLHAMQEKKLKRVVIVDEKGRLIGAVSQKELLDTIYSKLTQRGFFNLGHLNQILTEQVDRQTKELKNLNRQLASKVEAALEEIRIKDRKIAERKKNDVILELLINVAHHWRQPLHMLGLMTQDIVLAKKFSQLDIGSLEKFEYESMAILKGLSKSIDNFLNLFRDNGDKVEFVLEESIAKTASVVEEQFASSNIFIEIDSSSTHNYNGFENEFKQVILSVLLNSRDIILADNVTSKDGAIKIGISSSDESINIECRTNCGTIGAEQIDKLFNPQLVLGEEAQCIGLFISKEIASNYLNGELTAVTYSDGISFVVTLPKMSK